MVGAGLIPHDIGTIGNIMWSLNCRNNNLTGPIPSTLFNMSRLQALGLSANSLSGNLPSSPGLWSPNLEQLYIGKNNLSGVIPNSISNATNLHLLELSQNMFTGSIPHSLGNLRLLEVLDLGSNQLTGDDSELSFFTSVTNCRHLRSLWLSFNPLNGILPPTIGNFSSSIQVITVAGCEIMGRIPREIGNLSSLILLSANRNNLTGIVPTTIRGLPNLQRLFLGENRLQGPIPVDICHLNHLGTLYLAQNKFFGPLPECLGNITSLRYVDLGSNRLTSNIPKSFCNFKDLLQFSLFSNSLSGYLPSELGNLKVAVEIDLSMNQFSGAIPSTIGGLLSLEILYLDHNRLEGSIPQTFGKLISMESLDMSHNNLTGEIPKSLEALIQLKYFNVSFNRLSGEIPSGGPFANLTNESFMLNEALCGAPRLNVPPCQSGSPRQSRKRRLLLLTYVSLPIASILFAMAITFSSKRCRRSSVNPAAIDTSPVRSHQRIAYHELLRATNLFTKSNLLGTGSFSSVYKGILQDGTILAVKVFNLKLEGAFRSFDTECEILRNLRHRNLTGVISSCSTPDFKGLVLEYMPNGTVEKWLYSHNYFLDILKRLEIMIDVACALEYLHYGYSTPVVHCDLKPSNVLLDNDMVAHVSDFGISKFLYGESIAQTKTIATIGYIAPGNDSRFNSFSNLCFYFFLFRCRFEFIRHSSIFLTLFVHLMNIT